MAIRLVNIVFLSDSKNSDQTPIHLSRLVQLYSDLPLVGGYIETSKIKIRDAKEKYESKDCWKLQQQWEWYNNNRMKAPTSPANGLQVAYAAPKRPAFYVLSLYTLVLKLESARHR